VARGRQRKSEDGGKLGRKDSKRRIRRGPACWQKPLYESSISAEITLFVRAGAGKDTKGGETRSRVHGYGTVLAYENPTFFLMIFSTGQRNL